MKKRYPALTILGAVLYIGTIALGGARAAVTTSTASSLTRDQLQAQVQDKAKQLEVVNQQLASTTAVLKNTTQQRQTLQQQLNVLSGNIKTLNLGIQADTLTTQQLQLEIQSLGYDLQDISDSIDTKRSAIERLLQEFQKNDTANGNLLAVFLKSKTFSMSIHP